ncbi:MAG: SDR family oxidoreductase [Blastocatellia bacterium]|nr:SDR family oxidoreductase [Blastocatellia bacterium]
MAGEKVLVTGGAGFIGSHLVDGLLAKNYKVKVLDNFTTGKKGNLSSVLSDIELITGDIRDEEAIKKAVLGVDFVLHQAALGSVPRSIDDPLTTHECNSTGTLKLLLAARDAGVQRLVYASSSSVYGNTPTLPKIETMPPSPRSPYALSKLSGEIYCQLFSSLYGFETVSLRYFNVFGPRQDEHSQYAAVIPKFVTALLKGESITIFGDGSQTRDFTFIENVVAANLLAMTAPKETAATAVDISCSGYYSILSVGEKLANILNTSLKVNFAESRPGCKDSYADISKAKELIKYIPKVDFQTGLKQTAEWFQAQYLELVK